MTPKVIPILTSSAPVDQDATSQLAAALEREARLDAFICWAMRQSHIGDYSPCQAMQLLNSAWEAQKLLSDLRRQRLTEQP